MIEKLQEALQKVFEENQSRPDQYVVGYFKMKDDSLIGYHADTFNNITPELYQGKRYSGLDNASQLTIIWNNFKSLMNYDKKDGIFHGIIMRAKIPFEGLKIEDVYIDAIYLDSDAPKQKMRFQIIQNG